MSCLISNDSRIKIFSVIFIPVPDDGFRQKPKCSTFLTIKYIVCKYRCGLRSVCLCIRELILKRTTSLIVLFDLIYPSLLKKLYEV